MSRSKNKEPVYIQIRLKRDRETGLMHVTESAQDNLNQLTDVVKGSNSKRRDSEKKLQSAKIQNR